MYSILFFIDANQCVCFALCGWVFIDFVDVLLVFKQYASDGVQFGFFYLFYWIIVFYLVGNNCLFECIYTKGFYHFSFHSMHSSGFFTVTIKDEEKKL
jgi:hypothetical protein